MRCAAGAGRSVPTPAAHRMMSPGFRRRPATTAAGPGSVAVLRPDRSLIRRLAGETEGDAKCRSAVERERRHCELYYPRSRLVARRARLPDTVKVPPLLLVGTSLRTGC